MRGCPFVLAFAVCALQAAALEIKVEADHADCVYAVGETAKLSVTFTEKDGSAPTGGIVRAALDNFGAERVFETRELDLGATNRFEFAKALPYPGFLRLRLAHPERPRLPQDDPEWYMWSVAFSPERIVQGAENPADFDAYWKREKARLECEVPLDAKVAKDESQSNEQVDWPAARDDVDLRSFVYEGTSQGGAAGLALGCLNSHFTKIAVYVPAMTDILGDRWYARQAGWPYLVSGQLDAASKDAAEMLAPYYEGANFARRIVCPVRFAVGFADRTCPPHAVYAAFNACGSSDKKITHGLGMTHDCFGWIYTENGKWAAETAR